jgi:hypothetical protein
MSVTIRTTCTSCQQTSYLDSNAVILALPAADDDGQPTALHSCPRCGGCTSRSIAWRMATYLMDAGVTTIIAPMREAVAPRYPELRPAITEPMTLDDLIDLLASLDTDARAA